MSKVNAADDGVLVGLACKAAVEVLARALGGRLPTPYMLLECATVLIITAARSAGHPVSEALSVVKDLTLGTSARITEVDALTQLLRQRRDPRN